MPTSETRLLTISEIAKRLNRDRHRIQYVVRSRNIKPAGIAGNTAVFHESEIAYIESELRRIDREKGVFDVAED